MNVQLDLMGETDPLGLSGRQRAVYDYLCSQHDGIDSDEAGAFWHHVRGVHDLYARCTFCGRDGLSVLRALRAKGLAVQRRKPVPGWHGLGEGDPRRGMPATSDGSLGDVGTSSSPSPSPGRGIPY